MPLTDLLWACPFCGDASGWRRVRAAARCGRCRITFRRGAGTELVAEGPKGREVASAAAWVRRLPEIRPPRRKGPDSVVQAGALLRRVRSMEPVRYADRFLGSFERFGPGTDGLFELSSDTLRFTPDGGAGEKGGDERQESLVWPLEAVTSVQASSRTLQFKPKGENVVSLALRDASCHYWHELLMATLRAFYRERGWGDIIEFQPRIETA